MFDVLIKGARIYDGDGGPYYIADVGIRGDRIVRIGNLQDADAGEVFDADGLCLMPGFIDVHTHSDAWLFHDPARAAVVCQGVTTETVGDCGIGIFPLSPDNRKEYNRCLRGILSDLPEDIRFSTCGEYLEALPPTGPNVAAKLAHSPIRMEAAGFHDVPLRGGLLDKAVRLTRQAFEEGAIGLTTGLSYYPASFCDTEEVIALCKVAATYDAPMSVHMRSVFRTADPAFSPTEEVLAFARKSGCAVHYTHYRTAPENAGQLDRLLDPILRGLSEGIRVTADFYPYPVGAGHCAFFLPLWVNDGGFDRIMERLRTPSLREKIIKDMQNYLPKMETVVFLHVPHHPEYLNRSIVDVAKERSQTVPEALLDILCEEDLLVGFTQLSDYPRNELQRNEQDFMALIQKPYYMVGSDSIPMFDFPHPRTYGTFAKILRLAGEHEVDLSLLANRLSKLPAQTFHLAGRGEIKEGKFADLCVFAPGEIKDIATYNDPKHLSQGMRLVMVNGKIAVRDGKPTGVCAGRALRRGIQ